MKIYPETYKTKKSQETDQKEKEDRKETVYFDDIIISLPLCFVRKCLSEKVVPKLTLGNGKWARINEFEIDGCDYIAVHMNNIPTLWKLLIDHAGELLKQEKPVVIAGDFKACSPLDPSGGCSSSRGKDFALLLSMGYVDLTPKIKTFSSNHHNDHILVSPAFIVTGTDHEAKLGAAGIILNSNKK